MSNTGNRLRLEFPALSCNERVARTVVSAFLLEADPTADELAEIRTAVSEAVTNSIVHGYGERGGNILMLLDICTNVFTVTVIDRGVGIEDIALAREPLYSGGGEERSGMGFTIMETFMDSLDVKSTPGKGTTVIMSKRIGKGPDTYE